MTFSTLSYTIIAQTNLVVPNDPLFNQQWGLTKIMAPESWSVEKGSSSVIVAVVDTGVDYRHPDLEANMWTAPDGAHGWNFVENDSDPMDTYGHGTEVAGVIGAVCNNEIGVCGVAWNIRIMAVRVESGSETDYNLVAEGIRYAANHGARIMNLSLIGGSSGYRRMQDAINYAYSKGVLLIQSAGNGDEDISNRSDVSPGKVMYVAGTDPNDRKAQSNFGAIVDVCAPYNATTTLKDSHYGDGAGTSFSAAYVTGLAALLFSHYPSLTNDQVRQIIRSTADNIDSLNSGYAGKLGSGRINAYRALTAVDISLEITVTGSTTTYMTSTTTRVPEFSNLGPITVFTISMWILLRSRLHCRPRQGPLRRR